MKYIVLILAIASEVAGTSALQASKEFTRLWASVAVVVCYGLSFYLLCLALRYFPVGIAYAIWSGLGIVLISIVGLVVFKQSLDLPAFIGIGLILVGVIVIELFSQASPH
ncbi:SMR family transporter [Desulfovibrio inopinatus]|uniref:SMR family transporter n=1 Tax=Desulfovibrio inopinatus TaxID=102109 RepID=UPI0004226CA6|nr:SMR family transporter [Desulfovibrio inopinatus]